MKEGKYGSRRQVMNGSKEKTRCSRLEKSDLIRNKKGYLVSKRQHEAGKRRSRNIGFQTWNIACRLAKEKLNLKGFILIKKGTEVYKLAKILQQDLKKKMN